MFPPLHNIASAHRLESVCVACLERHSFTQRHNRLTFLCSLIRWHSIRLGFNGYMMCVVGRKRCGWVSSGTVGATCAALARSLDPATTPHHTSLRISFRAAHCFSLWPNNNNNNKQRSAATPAHTHDHLPISRRVLRCYHAGMQQEPSDVAISHPDTQHSNGKR